MTDCTVVAFDPGVTTGWATMTVTSDDLLGRAPKDSVRTEPRELHQAVAAGDWRWGQIDSAALGSSAAGVGVGRGHDALNFVGENLAVDEMMKLAVVQHPDAAILLEKFVLDPKAASGKFDLISPVRMISAFSYALHADAMSLGPYGMPKENVRDPYSRFNLISRGDPKRTCNNERMKRWGFSNVVTHSTRHACDASRIAYYFLRDCVGSSPKAQEARWRAWPQIFADPQVRRPVPKQTRSLGERI